MQVFAVFSVSQKLVRTKLEPSMRTYAGTKETLDKAV